MGQTAEFTLAAVDGAAGENVGEVSTLADKQRHLPGFLHILAHSDGEGVPPSLLFYHRRV